MLHLKTDRGQNHPIIGLVQTDVRCDVRLAVNSEVDLFNLRFRFLKPPTKTPTASIMRCIKHYSTPNFPVTQQGTACF